MNIYTKMIADQLGIDMLLAYRIQERMECSDLDFSECTKNEFKRAVIQASECLTQEGS